MCLPHIIHCQGSGTGKEISSDTSHITISLDLGPLSNVISKCGPCPAKVSDSAFAKIAAQRHIHDIGTL